MAAPYNIVTVNNSDFNLNVEWTTSIGNSSTAVDLTGYTAQMQVKTASSSSTPLISLGTLPLSGITLNNPIGNISLNIPASVYTNIPAGSYVYDLIIVGPSGNAINTLQGTFTLNAGVTQSSNQSIAPLATSGGINPSQITCSNVVLLGGAIDNIAIGQESPALGSFTTLSYASLSSSALILNAAPSGGQITINNVNSDYRINFNSANLAINWIAPTKTTSLAFKILRYYFCIDTQCT